MMTVIYGTVLFVSIVVLIYLAQKEYENTDIYQWTMVLIMSVVIAAHWLKSQVETADGAYLLQCFAYFDSTYLFSVLIIYLLHILGIRIWPWVKIALYGLASIHVLIVFFCYHTDLYYSGVTLVETSMGTAVHFAPGPLKVLHTAYIAFMMGVLLSVLVLAVRRRGSYPLLHFVAYLMLPLLTMLLYGVEVALGAGFSLTPVLYGLGAVMIAFQYDKAHSYDIDFLIADAHREEKEKGYLAVTPEGEFLCCNEKCKDFLPFLHDVRVDGRLPENDRLGRKILQFLSSYEKGYALKTKYKLGEMTCIASISSLDFGNMGECRGYLIEIYDGTEDQRNLDILSDFNRSLNEEVQEKTRNIKEIQRKVVLGMADLIDNRDSNTGGHVRRTSDIISIIVGEILRQGLFSLTEQQGRDIVRAAPTHDLGKVPIENNILNKPGRFTEEEYDIMKTHATKSGEMVKILLEGVEEEHFVQVAYNVARYHHERWDGKGYPEGLVGSMIPLEARIMAVADVYDALVSKRVYKEPLSFEKSAAIMCEGMGTQFDPRLKQVFLGCREELEQYYLQHDR